jgi:hypothetical protein
MNQASVSTRQWALIYFVVVDVTVNESSVADEVCTSCLAYSFPTANTAVGATGPNQTTDLFIHYARTVKLCSH